MWYLHFHVVFAKLLVSFDMKNSSVCWYFGWRTKNILALGGVFLHTTLKAFWNPRPIRVFFFTIKAWRENHMFSLQAKRACYHIRNYFMQFLRSSSVYSRVLRLLFSVAWPCFNKHAPFFIDKFIKIITTPFYICSLPLVSPDYAKIFISLSISAVDRILSDVKSLNATVIWIQLSEDSKIRL